MSWREVVARAVFRRVRGRLRRDAARAPQTTGLRRPAASIAYTVAVLLALGLALLLAGGQERPVPNDSLRVIIPGCAKDRLFVVEQPEGREIDAAGIGPGRRFRLSGPRSVLDDIKKREGRMVEITGLVRKNDVNGGGGWRVLGGRVRIGGTMPRDPVRDPMYNQIVIDVEGFQLLPDSCPSR